MQSSHPFKYNEYSDKRESMSSGPVTKTRAVFLDAAGTLFESVRPVAVTYAELARRYGKHVPFEEVSRRFRHCFATAPPMAFPGSAGARLEALEKAWWRDVVRRVFETTGPFTRFDDYFDELFAYFARSDSWVLYDDARPALDTLRAHGLILVMISNFDSRVLKIIQGLGVADCFDSVFISSSAGFAKPSAGIFRLALERHGLAPDEAIHVGDSPETDVEGARNAGVRPVLLDRDGDARHDTGHDAAHRIDGLHELPSLIESSKLLGSNPT